jgi:phosphoribosylglycinamide formyltransferase-1
MKIINSKRIVFLCSGGGGNLRFIKAASENGWFGQAVLIAVLTDRECGANDYARSHGIDEKSIDFSANGQSDLINSLDYYKPDIVITTVHRILNEAVVEKFRGRLINLHYSLLPAFAGFIGTKPVREALVYGTKLVGITVHLVDESLDGGKPLMQVAIPVKSLDNLDILMDLQFRCGCLSLGSVINSCFLDDRKLGNTTEEVVKIKDRYCLFSNRINATFDIKNEAFWDAIKL